MNDVWMYIFIGALVAGLLTALNARAWFRAFLENQDTDRIVADQILQRAQSYEAGQTIVRANSRVMHIVHETTGTALRSRTAWGKTLWLVRWDNSEEEWVLESGLTVV